MENTLRQIAYTITGFPRLLKQAIVVIVDIIFIFSTVWLAFSIRYEEWYSLNIEEISVYLSALIIALPILHFAGLYRSIFRYSGFSVLNTVGKACLLYGIFYYMVITKILSPGFPRSIGILQPILLFLTVGGSRAFARILLHPTSKNSLITCNKENILIYGAGSSGVQIATVLQHNAKYAVAGFVDDDKYLVNKSINGIKVFNPLNVPHLIKEKKITSILMAMPSTKRTRRKEIYAKFEGLGVHIRTLPDIEDIAGGKISISDIREIDIGDLLGRDQVPPIPSLFSQCISSKNVLVTGAGGSIGSELCRQIIAQKPSTLILLENTEFNLYTLEKELRSRIDTRKYHVKLIPILADVTDKRNMKEIFHIYKPDTVYHAAAYKHVPIVEENPYEGLRNNVFGTLSVAQAAISNNVSHMVLVSTDKAVRPTNIMGASKRIAELILQAMSSEQSIEKKTCFSIVRFGNVLGSSGSVVPLFRQQISEGGPVTVTDKEMTRYFMTIPEAAQLVIQAGAMAKGGEVFLLDMGNPVKIYDLAIRMIELSGLTVKNAKNTDGDISIITTGLRPGEKLYEELLIGDNPIHTKHSRIYKAHESHYQYSELMRYLKLLECIMYNYNDNSKEELKKLLKIIVKGYHINEVKCSYIENVENICK